MSAVGWRAVAVCGRVSVRRGRLLRVVDGVSKTWAGRGWRSGRGG
ncbi:MAG: hypothetical protein QW057_05015 [Candidatus Bathyarchaeia archaeon]